MPISINEFNNGDDAKPASNGGEVTNAVIQYLHDNANMPFTSGEIAKALQAKPKATVSPILNLRKRQNEGFRVKWVGGKLAVAYIANADIVAGTKAKSKK